ncbi:WD40 repeat domain-containing protein [Streptomyces sp. NPDC046759]|uniref:WD40 repeat domain-containing protein n=1 Tax=Streptomyces sp. NPDC046759 TaxID=3155019 RepID=UPI0033D7BA2B
MKLPPPVQRTYAPTADPCGPSVTLPVDQCLVGVWLSSHCQCQLLRAAVDTDVAPAVSRRAACAGVAPRPSALAFSHDGSTLAVAGPAGSVQFGDVASQRLLGFALPTPGDLVLALSFGSDDGTLYASGTNVPVQKYDLTPAQLTAQVCKRSGSGLSKRDWKTYLPNVPYRHTC